MQALAKLLLLHYQAVGTLTAREVCRQGGGPNFASRFGGVGFWFNILYRMLCFTFAAMCEGFGFNSYRI